MSKPIATIISDIHFNLNTLPLASQALRAALLKAETLQVPLIIAGDLNDSKAIIRAEVANEIIDILKPAKTKVYILVGNHDLINEKGSAHGLNYLKPYAEVVDYHSQHAAGDPVPGLWLIPYKSNVSDFLEAISIPRKGEILICHQGFLGAQMGDYIQDKTSIDPELVKNFTVISGHYHRHQTIGTVTYVGSPFTMSFGEANDGPKGSLVLNSDGSFTREILNLRRHVKLEWTVEWALRVQNVIHTPPACDGDLVWIKVSGPYSELQKIKKQYIAERLGLENFKLDLIPTDSAPTTIDAENLTSEQVFDTLIDGTPESDEQKRALKLLWRSLV